MLYEIMRHCRNFFPCEHRDGTFEIKGGIISLPFVYEGQYYIVEGSVFNDGLHKYPEEGMQDEKFDGYITTCKIPKAFIELAEEIEEWCEKNPQNGYQSESFGGYSYTKATVDGKIAGWQQVFASKLSDWRKV